MSTQLPYQIEIDNRRAVISLLPELNEVPWADIEKVGSEILGRIQSIPTPSLLVDLCALNYMGSAQVALVVRLFKMIKERNGKMVVANRHPMVLEVLTLAGLNKVWTIVDSRDRGLSMLGGGMSMSVVGGGNSMGGANSMPGFTALIAAFVAALLLVLHFANPALIPGRGDLIGALAASAIAILAGFWAMNSGGRSMGLGVLVVSMVLLLVGVFEIAKSANPAPNADEKAAQEDAENTTQEDPAEETAAPQAGAQEDSKPEINLKKSENETTPTEAADQKPVPAPKLGKKLNRAEDSEAVADPAESPKAETPAAEPAKAETPAEESSEKK